MHVCMQNRVCTRVLISKCVDLCVYERVCGLVGLCTFTGCYWVQIALKRAELIASHN